MRAALSMTVVGIWWSYRLARPLGWEWPHLLWALGMASLAWCGAILLVLKAERSEWVRNRILTSVTPAWCLGFTIYCLILVLGVPRLHHWPTLRILFWPLTLGGGLGILAFGPLQDYLVRRRMPQTPHRRRVRLRSSLHSATSLPRV